MNMEEMSNTSCYNAGARRIYFEGGVIIRNNCHTS